MRWIRASARLGSLLVVTVGFELLWLLCILPARAVGRGEPWRAAFFRTWARAALFLMGVRIETRGAPPRAPFLLVSNHLSYLDIAVYARETGARFVAKSEVASWPLVGWLARSVGTVFVDRTNHRDLVRVGNEMGGAIEEGGGVVLFPEGTSTSGREVATFRPSLLANAAREGGDVHHASIRYATRRPDPPASTAVAWWGDMTFGPHIWKLLSLRRVEARIVFGEGPIQDPDRKSLAQRLHRAVGAHFEALEH